MATLNLQLMSNTMFHLRRYFFRLTLQNEVPRISISMSLSQREATPADTTQWISVFFMVFGAIGTVIVVLGLYFSLKDSNSNTQNVGKKVKKRARKTAKTSAKPHNS